MAIPHTGNAAVETSNLGEASKATMNMSPKAAKMLADNLYKNKILAVMREYSTNAIDGQIAAGKPDEPFDVKLPTRFDPEFAVRDYGPGLSHQFIMECFNCYFYSTKDTSNDQNGMLGLGSKAGHALKVPFSVISRQQGEKRVYSAFLGNDGMPTITHNHTERTDEPDGFEVKIPVQGHDIDRFRETARHLYTYFNPRPNLLNARGVEIYEPEYMLSGSGWALRKDSVHRSRPQAIMGSNAYPISPDAMNMRLDETEEAVLRMPIDLWFNMGELDVAMSREELSYDDETCQAIRKRVSAIALQIPTMFARKIQKATNWWEAKRLFGQEVENAALSPSIKQVLRSQLKWQGHLIGTSRIDLSLSYQAGFQDAEVCLLNREEFRKVNLKLDWGTSERLFPEHDIRILWDDGEQRKKRQVIRWNFDNSTSQVLVIKANRAEFFKALAQLGTDQYTRLADLEEPPKEVKANPNSRYRSDIQKVYAYTTDGWKQTSHDANQGGFYIDLYRWDEIDKSRNIINWDYIHRKAREIGILANSEPVYGIPGSHKHVRNKDGWVNILDVLHDRLAKHIQENNLERSIANLNHWEANHSDDMIDDIARRLIRHDVWPSKKVGSPMRKLMNAVQEMQQVDPNLKTIISLAERLGVQYKKVKPSHDLADLTTKCRSQYPIITRVLGVFSIRDDFRHGGEKLQKWMDYINFCD